MWCDADRVFKMCMHSYFKSTLLAWWQTSKCHKIYHDANGTKISSSSLRQCAMCAEAIIAKLSARKMWMRWHSICPCVCVSASAIVCLIGHCRVISVSPAFSLWLHPAALCGRMQERELSTCTRALNLIPFEWMRKSSASGKCGVCYWWKTISSCLSRHIECIFRVRSRTLQLLTLLLSVLESAFNDCIELFHYWGEYTSETFCLSSSIGLFDPFTKTPMRKSGLNSHVMLIDKWGNILMLNDRRPQSIWFAQIVFYCSNASALHWKGI